MELFALALIFFLNNFIWMIFFQSQKESVSFTEKVMEVVPKVRLEKKRKIDEMDVRNMGHGEVSKALDTLLGIKK
jgi:hypothetical protein